MLLIDAGNTAIKYRRVVNGELKKEWIFLPEGEGKPYDDNLTFTDEDVWISSVRGKDIPLPPGSNIQWVGPHLHLPFEISNTLKNSLGADRLCVYAALTELCPLEAVACAITLGTAITYNVMTPGHRAIGGAISPGPAMRFNSLHQATRQLPLTYANEAFDFPAETTSQAICAGVMQGITHELNGFADQICQQFSPDTTFFLCGGFASDFENQFKKRNFVFPDLVLKGLYRLALLNRNV